MSRNSITLNFIVIKKKTAGYYCIRKLSLYSENYTKVTKRPALCGQNAEVSKVRAGSSQSYRPAFKLSSTRAYNCSFAI
jgi:hypothetical protein